MEVQMSRVHSLCQSIFLLSLFFAPILADDVKTTMFHVVGTGECADCKDNNFKPSQAFSGLYVTIDCKINDGDMKRVGSSELNEQGKFEVSLPREVVVNGQKLKHACYAQLHSATAIPCPAHAGLEASKIVFKSVESGKQVVFAPSNKLQFSAALCTSKFNFPKAHPWLKNFGHPPLPPLYKHKPILPPIPFHKPLPPPVPVHKLPAVKPLPPPIPVYKPPKKPCPPTKPKPTVVKPLPPRVPVYKPKPPVYKPHKKPYHPTKPKPPIVKPLPPLVPIYKPPIVVKPLPPPVPIYKPPMVKPLPPPIPIYKPSFYKKPCPPLPPFPPKYFPPISPAIPHS